MLSPAVVTAYRDSVFTLVCAVTEHLVAPADFVWWLNDSRVALATHRGGGVNVENVSGRRSSTSAVTVVFARHEDAGTYRCQPIGLFDDTHIVSDRVQVRVIQRPHKHFFASSARDTRGAVTPALLIFASCCNYIFSL